MPPTNPSRPMARVEVVTPEALIVFIALLLALFVVGLLLSRAWHGL